MTQSYATPSPAFPPRAFPTPRQPSPFRDAVRRFWQQHRTAVPGVTLIACAAVGLAGGALLVGYRPGLGMAVVALLLWVPAVPAMVRRRALSDLLTAVMSVALVAVVAVRDAAWVVALCLLGAAVAAAVAATSARSGPAVLLSLASWAAGLVRALPWAGRGVGAVVGSRRGQILVVLRSPSVTVVLLVVFGLLFASADRLFASYLPRVDLGLLPFQLIVAVLVATVAATLAHLSLAPPEWSTLSLPPGRAARRWEWLLPVLSLDALVLAFVLVQVGALREGHQHVLETAGLTYAEYTRQGFAELMVVTMLTLLVVAVAARRAPRSGVLDRTLSRVALGVLSMGTLGVVASALRRMDLYVDAFGLTRLRLFVVVFELALAAVLVLLLVAGIRWRGGWLPRSLVQVAAVAMLSLALLNPDAQIVRHNTAPGLDTPLDVSYLTGLSADAVPDMELLEEPLRSCLLTAVHLERSQGLPDWNVGRERAQRVLTDPPLRTDAACPGYDPDR